MEKKQNKPFWTLKYMHVCGLLWHVSSMSCSKLCCPQTGSHLNCPSLLTLPLETPPTAWSTSLTTLTEPHQNPLLNIFHWGILKHVHPLLISSHSQSSSVKQNEVVIIQLKKNMRPMWAVHEMKRSWLYLPYQVCKADKKRCHWK